MLECVVNVATGDAAMAEALAATCPRSLLDVHCDADYERSVLTLAGPALEQEVRRLARTAVEVLDFTRYAGVHPALGVLDVVPFVPLALATMADALRARDEMAAWIASELGVPVFLYGPERPLPEVRRHAFASLAPDLGPPKPGRAGSVTVGARQVLVAWNVNLDADLDCARRAARAVRGPRVRALAWQAGTRVQVSMNLVDPVAFSPVEALSVIEQLCPVASTELVGLVPRAMLSGRERALGELGIDESVTIEARLHARA
jgi:glutamate formiminotransferase